MIKLKLFKKGDIDTSFCDIRKEVFVKEQGFPLREEFDDWDLKVPHLCVFSDGVPCATGRFIPIDSETVKIGRIAVAKDKRKMGFGEMVVTELLKKAKSEGNKKAIVGAQTQAQKFYEKCGFAVVGTDIYLECNIPHIDMEISL